MKKRRCRSQATTIFNDHHLDTSPHACRAQKRSAMNTRGTRTHGRAEVELQVIEKLVLFFAFFRRRCDHDARDNAQRHRHEGHSCELPSSSTMRNKGNLPKSGKTADKRGMKRGQNSLEGARNQKGLRGFTCMCLRALHVLWCSVSRHTTLLRNE